MRKKECVAMLLAGGQGSRLGILTQEIAKPAVSFGGKYRMIDFSLSNCVNSGIDTVGVLIQYKPFLLNKYLGTGAAWDLDASWGGVHVLARPTPPRRAASGTRGRRMPSTTTLTLSTATTRSMCSFSRGTICTRWTTT